MNIAILGFDTEGRSSFDYFHSQGHDITILDQKTDISLPSHVASVLGDRYLDDLDRFDLIVRTAGLPPHLIFDRNPGLDPAKVTTQVNEFFRLSPTRNIIGITGTKGKGTTSTLITKILQAAGKDVQLGGNIGIPVLELLPKLQAASWAVLELSSFQLSDFRYAPKIGVCLMIVPEHLNWHADFADYVHAKRKLFIRQTPDDLMVYNADNPTSTEVSTTSQAHQRGYSLLSAQLGEVYTRDGHIYFGETEICAVDEIALLGAHNVQNVCAAIAATWEVTGENREAVRSVITTFHGLEHRLELVRTLDGVAYYDDSFGTTPETAIVAIQAFQEPKVIILGGSDKGTGFDELAQVVAGGNVKHALLIGDTAPAIEASLRAAGFTAFSPGGTTMEEIVSKAHHLADSGDVVLLSTGCASFGMFKDYKDRAAQFQQAVQSL